MKIRVYRYSIIILLFKNTFEEFIFYFKQVKKIAFSKVFDKIDL